jgi:hypothetical protein
VKTHHENTAEEIHGPFRWRTFEPTDSSVTDGTIEEASEALGLDVPQVEWAIEEYGRCDMPKCVAWKPGPVEMGTNEEIIGGGFEWPASEAPSA